MVDERSRSLQHHAEVTVSNPLNTFSGKKARLFMNGVPINFTEWNDTHEPYDHSFYEKDGRVYVEGHTTVRWIDFDKMIACVVEYDKLRYRRIVVLSNKKWLEVVGTAVKTYFAHKMYEYYERKVANMVVE